MTYAEMPRKRRASRSKLEAAGQLLVDNLMAEADRQSGPPHHLGAVAHELRTHARDVSSIVRNLTSRMER